jgi:hypothetical protein
MQTTLLRLYKPDNIVVKFVTLISKDSSSFVYFSHSSYLYVQVDKFGRKSGELVVHTDCIVSPDGGSLLIVRLGLPSIRMDDLTVGMSNCKTRLSIPTSKDLEAYVKCRTWMNILVITVLLPCIYMDLIVHRDTRSIFVKSVGYLGEHGKKY